MMQSPHINRFCAPVYCIICGETTQCMRSQVPHRKLIQLMFTWEWKVPPMYYDVKLPSATWKVYGILVTATSYEGFDFARWEASPRILQVDERPHHSKLVASPRSNWFILVQLVYTGSSAFATRFIFHSFPGIAACAHSLFTEGIY